MKPVISILLAALGISVVAAPSFSAGNVSQTLQSSDSNTANDATPSDSIVDDTTLDLLVGSSLASDTMPDEDGEDLSTEMGSTAVDQDSSTEDNTGTTGMPSDTPSPNDTNISPNTTDSTTSPGTDSGIGTSTPDSSPSNSTISPTANGNNGNNSGSNSNGNGASSSSGPSSSGTSGY
jgi:hypothetical protein